LAKKDLKINIKNTQIAQAIQLDKLKHKLDKKKTEAKEKKEPSRKEEVVPEHSKEEKEDTTRHRKARSKSVFAEATPKEKEAEEIIAPTEQTEEVVPIEAEQTSVVPPEEAEVAKQIQAEPLKEVIPPKEEVKAVEPQPLPKPVKEVLGPTGRHINDLLPPKKKIIEPVKEPVAAETDASKKNKEKLKKGKPKEETPAVTEDEDKKSGKVKFKEFRDVKPAARKQQVGRFDARDRQGLGEQDDDQRWRKRKHKFKEIVPEDLTIRPKELHIRLPITVKDLASEMKLKSSQLIQKLFLQGVIVTINDILDDETTIQLLGQEFDCEITIDTTEEERIRITDQTIKEEISKSDPDALSMRAPVVTFMGHVDHGKTSLIDFIRSSSIAAGEAGAITQHIGAFLCQTAVGNIAVLDTPGHEAFSEMRARGADVTDIVVLVIAGDEGIRAQTEEAINHAKAAGVTIIVAANKCDKPNFDIENVNRQLADHDLLPEAWGGQTIVVKCSAKTGEGVKELLEMLAIQAEVLELKANPNTRARGTVLESELHKGMGTVATVLVQNGTLKLGDALVFGEHWGRVKTMRDEFGNSLQEAPPSTPIEITGLSGLPAAGDDFIAVPTEKEARDIAEERRVGERQKYLQQSKKISLESLFHQAADKKKKVLKIVLRADVQGSMEALKAALLKIESDKVDIDIISAGVGEISESDVLLAAASKAFIIGFHTQVEFHAESLIKQHKVLYTLHDIIYHAIDNVKDLMAGLLDKLAQENDKGKAEVKATFKSSHLGTIAGCIVTEGSIHRNNHIRVMRGGEMVWKGAISSLKRVKEDVREVQKGLECGILLTNFNDAQEGDILEAYEIVYISQEL
jgi:translation initiation factor IF-2